MDGSKPSGSLPPAPGYQPPIAPKPKRPPPRPQKTKGLKEEGLPSHQGKAMSARTVTPNEPDGQKLCTSGNKKLVEAAKIAIDMADKNKKNYEHDKAVDTRINNLVEAIERFLKEGKNPKACENAISKLNEEIDKIPTLATREATYTFGLFRDWIQAPKNNKSSPLKSFKSLSASQTNKKELSVYIPAFVESSKNLETLMKKPVSTNRQALADEALKSLWLRQKIIGLTFPTDAPASVHLKGMLSLIYTTVLQLDTFSDKMGNLGHITKPKFESELVTAPSMAQKEKYMRGERSRVENEAFLSTDLLRSLVTRMRGVASIPENESLDQQLISLNQQLMEKGKKKIGGEKDTHQFIQHATPGNMGTDGFEYSPKIIQEFKDLLLDIANLVEQIQDKRGIESVFR